MIAELNLYDIWREEHPEERKFTWKRKLKKNTLKMGRLDIILVSWCRMKYFITVTKKSYPKSKGSYSRSGGRV